MRPPPLTTGLGAALGLSLCLAGQATLARVAAADKRPSLSIKANPVVGITPARVSLTAELKGGADDDQEFYCLSEEWNWGDETESESKQDCAPYEAGKSQIKRRFTTSRVFKIPGSYQVTLRLKRKDKVVTSSSVAIQIRQGLDDPDR